MSVAESSLTLTSSAFKQEGNIPSLYTCEGKDISPPLQWGQAPPGTKSFVLIVDDPDAPDPKAPKMTWVHWVLFNIPVMTTSVSEAIRTLPPGTGEGLNDWKRTGYGGPCPPIGKHRYFFKLAALDVVLNLKRGATKAEVEQAMQGHVLASAQLIGLYEKQRK